MSLLVELLPLILRSLPLFTPFLILVAFFPDIALYVPKLLRPDWFEME